MDNQSPLIFYYYCDLTDTECFCREVEKRFRETGHGRKIEFRIWDCYDSRPGRDGDLFFYDASVLSALRKDGFFRELPDIIDVSDTFEWARDNTLSEHRRYGVPVLGCCLAVICRKRDYEPFRNVFGIRGRITTHLRSLILNCYKMSFCNYQGNIDGVLDTLRRLMESMGPDLCRKSTLSETAVTDAFLDGSHPYFIGFTEALRSFPEDEYVVELANFSEFDENAFPIFMVDLLSMGKDVKEEKLLDCLDLMEIISRPDFVYGMCNAGDKLQYMLPVSRTAVNRLAQLDGIYNRFYELLDNKNNCVLRYGADYYEMIGDFKKDTLRLIGLTGI